MEKYIHFLAEINSTKGDNSPEDKTEIYNTVTLKSPKKL